MKPVLSHISALEFWRSVRIEPRRYRAVSRAKSLLASAPSIAALPDPGPWWLSRPLHVLVADAGARRPSRQVRCHVWGGPLPKGAVLDTGNEFCICSPELCYMQAAESLGLVGLVRLGYELCGTYDVSEAEIRTCPPLTSVKRLRTFIEGLPGARGREKALRALRYVADNSASPMETVLAMLLCLPCSLGGHGIAPPHMNHRIEIRAYAKKTAAKNYYVCDLYWPEYRIAVEYDSTAFHARPGTAGADAARRNALEGMDTVVLSVAQSQITSGAEIEKIARLIARHSKKRLRHREPSFTKARAELRGELLGT